MYLNSTCRFHDLISSFLSRFSRHLGSVRVFGIVSLVSNFFIFVSFFAAMCVLESQTGRAGSRVGILESPLTGELHRSSLDSVSCHVHSIGESERELNFRGGVPR